MSYCGECGAEVQNSGATFCPQCGASITSAAAGGGAAEKPNASGALPLSALQGGPAAAVPQGGFMALEEGYRMHRLVFVGGFGRYFAWTLLMILSVIPVLGTWFQFLFFKWMTNNTVLAPIDINPELVRAMAIQRQR